jgi:hypothetical protein
MPDDIALVPSEQLQQTAPETALDKVAANLSMLKPKEDSLLVVSSKSLGDVLPAKFYEGASELVLNDEEKAVLAQYQDAQDEEIEIRPDGLIYVEHITIRRALCKVFGTEWACIPGSPIAQDKMEKGILVAQRWVLVIRGHYIGEAIGAGQYWAENPQQNKTDAAEAAQSEAIRRICAKGSLGICSNVYQKAFQRRWRAQYAVEVWVKGYSGNRKLWRRKDAEPFEGEIGPIETKSPSMEGSQDARKGRSRTKTDDPVRVGQSNSGNAAAGKPLDATPMAKRNALPEPAARDKGGDEGPSPDWSDTEPEPEKPEPQHVYVASKQGAGCAQCGKAMDYSSHVKGQIREEIARSASLVTPAVAAPTPGTPMVQENNFRWFMAQCRRAKLVNGEVAQGAIALIGKACNVALPKRPGRTEIETLHAMFMTLTMEQFNKVLIPEVRERMPK